MSIQTNNTSIASINFLTVQTGHSGLIVVENNKNRFNTNMCFVGTGIVQGTPHKYFRIPIANVGNHPKTLTTCRMDAIAAKHPLAIMESPLTNGDVLVFAVDNVYNENAL